MYLFILLQKVRGQTHCKHCKDAVFIVCLSSHLLQQYVRDELHLHLAFHSLFCTLSARLQIKNRKAAILPSVAQLLMTIIQKSSTSPRNILFYQTVTCQSTDNAHSALFAILPVLCAISNTSNLKNCIYSWPSCEYKQREQSFCIFLLSNWAHIKERSRIHAIKKINKIITLHLSKMLNISYRAVLIVTISENH